MDSDTFLQKLADRKVLALPINAKTIRIVTHKDIDDDDVERAAEAMRRAFG
jgi:hypothetical protein